MRSATRLAAVLLTGVLAVATLAPPVAGKAVDQVFPVPSGGSYTVQGHGYGHGHGMSQYGARGAAREGLGWKKILRFYYPGTTLGTTADEIRVLIAADTTDDVVVLSTSGLTVRNLANGKVHALPTGSGITRWRITAQGTKSVVASYDGTWTAWKTFGGEAEFAADGRPVTLVTPVGSRAYRGALRSAAPSVGSSARDTVNVLSIDDYIKGVVPREMPASWEPAAVRAQSVAARTYAAWSRLDRMNAPWQICDTTSCQVYGGVSGEHALASAAVEATAGTVLLHGGQPAFTQYSSSSGGWTSQGSRPYLVHQPDPYEAASGNPYTNWSVKLSAATIQRAYPSIGTLRRVRVTEREGGGDWQGRVLSVRLEGARGTATLTGTTFRSRFGLRSTWFTLGTTSPEPTPAPVETNQRGPILTHWHGLGARDSVVGRKKDATRRLPGGKARDFRKGTIYWSSATGARELHGPILTRYRRLQESAHALGLPTRAVRPVAKGQRADFEHGKIVYVVAKKKTRVVLD